MVCRTWLSEAGLQKIAFVDGEVAGVAFFAVSQLEAMVRRHRERVASGLLRSLDYYLKDLGMAQDAR